MVISPATLLLTGSTEPKCSSDADVARTGDSGGAKRCSVHMLLALNICLQSYGVPQMVLLLVAIGEGCELRGMCDSDQPGFGIHARSELGGIEAGLESGSR